jgi:hypothetical protein
MSRRKVKDGFSKCCCGLLRFRYIPIVNRLTRQEQMVLCIVLGLLLTGLAVKAYRAAHPAPVSQAAN